MSAPSLPAARVLRPAFARLRFLRSFWRRWFLWVLLAMLVLALLVTVVWLAGRHEVEQTQTVLDRDTADAVSDLRDGLQRNVQTLRASLAGGSATRSTRCAATRARRCRKKGSPPSG